jgi:hypothetical protein
MPGITETAIAMGLILIVAITAISVAVMGNKPKH